MLVTWAGKISRKIPHAKCVVDQSYLQSCILTLKGNTPKTMFHKFVNMNVFPAEPETAQTMANVSYFTLSKERGKYTSHIYLKIKTIVLILRKKGDQIAPRIWEKNIIWLLLNVYWNSHKRCWLLSISTGYYYCMRMIPHIVYFVVYIYTSCERCNQAPANLIQIMSLKTVGREFYKSFPKVNWMQIQVNLITEIFAATYHAHSWKIHT